MRPRAALLGTAVIGAIMAGCYSFHRSEQPPAQLLARESPNIRVTLATGSRLEIRKPRLEGDSLIGIRVLSAVELRAPDLADKWPRVAVELAQVKSIEVRELNAVATVASVAVLGVGVALVVAAIQLSNTTFCCGGGGSHDGGDGTLSSCPAVYVWDGRDWRLDSGTFAGAIAEGLARTDVDLLPMVPTTGRRLRMRLVGGQAETDFTDHLAIEVVDHDPGTTIAPDGNGRLHRLTATRSPDAAHDFGGRAALARVAREDDWYWESVPTGRDSARVEDGRDGVILSFWRPDGATQATLLVDGQQSAWAAGLVHAFVGAHRSATDAWYDSLGRSPPMAGALANLLARTGHLEVSVWEPAGWRRQGAIREAGPEVRKRQVHPLDLSRVVGDTVKVRLESGVSIWLLDRVAIDYSGDRALTVSPASLVRATDQGGRDVTASLSAIDRQYLQQEPGDWAELEFRLPPPSPDRVRTVVLKSTGWYRMWTPTTGPPETALLQLVMSDSTAVSRMMVGRLNGALSALASRSRE